MVQRRWVGLSVALALLASLTGWFTEKVQAGVTCSLPFNLQNGTTADASQVMANYNAIVTCLGNAAAAGANSDITSLLGLTTPITPAEGGSTVFLGGTATNSGNSYIISSTTPPGFSLTAGYIVSFVASAANTGPATLSVNNQSLSIGVTFTNSSPVILGANSFSAGQPVTFATTGALPTNFTAGTTYYVIATGLSTSQFEVSATPGGSAITAGSAGSGTQTVTTAINIDRVTLSGKTPLLGSEIQNGQGVLAYYDGTEFLLLNNSNPPISTTFLQNYLAGLTLSAAGSTGTFGVAPGEASDSTNVSSMLLTTSYTKTTSSWAVGSGNGCLDTGSIANTTWYHEFLIQRTDTGLVDILCSLSATSPTLPSSYTLARRIGAMKTDASSHWLAFTQFGNDFVWATPINELNATGVGTAQVTQALIGVPSGVKVWARLRGSMNNTSVIASLLVQSPDETPTALLSVTGNITARMPISNASFALGELLVRTSTSAQIKLVSDNSATLVSMVSFGWTDQLGR